MFFHKNMQKWTAFFRFFFLQNKCLHQTQRWTVITGNRSNFAKLWLHKNVVGMLIRLKGKSCSAELSIPPLPRTQQLTCFLCGIVYDLAFTHTHPSNLLLYKIVFELHFRIFLVNQMKVNSNSRKWIGFCHCFHSNMAKKKSRGNNYFRSYTNVSF